jgi:hypothetical protein
MEQPMESNVKHSSKRLAADAAPAAQSMNSPQADSLPRPHEPEHASESSSEDGFAGGFLPGPNSGLPFLFLPPPALSTGEFVTPAGFGSDASDPGRDANEISAQALGVAQILKDRVVGRDELANLIRPLINALSDASVRSRHLVDDLSRPGNPRGSSAAAYAAMTGVLAEDEIEAFCRCETYFHVVRVQDLTRAELFACAAETCFDVLTDAAGALVGLETLIGLVDGTRELFRLHVPVFDSTDDRRGMLPAARVTEDLAGYRWYRGHHCFLLFTQACVRRLDDAHFAALAAKPELAASALASAALLMRGLTAGMGYASAFPGSIYRSTIRPAINRAGGPKGLSGTHHADYQALQQADARLKQHLRTGYGSNGANWPPTLLDAFLAYRRAEVAHTEQHVAIADAMVAGDNSLLSKTFYASLPPGGRPDSAVEILRDLAEAKRREFTIH